MAASRTKTVKVKKPATTAGSGKGGKSSAADGASKPQRSKGPTISKQLKEKNRAALLKKPKKKKYTAEELGVPKLNMITPVGVVKPKGKKKGKVFVDDRVRPLRRDFLRCSGAVSQPLGLLFLCANVLRYRRV